MKTLNKIALIGLAIIVGSVLLIIGLRSKIDPLWTEIDLSLNETPIMLKEAGNLLQKQYRSIHANDTIDAMELISHPFLPTVEWSLFESFLQKLLDDKKIIAWGVSGSGKTTRIDRVAKIITGSAERITKITCIQGLEAEYNREWVGYHGNDGFMPGKLLKLFAKCDRDSTHNYVLVIDDFDKIHRASFFGSKIWNELDNPSYDNYIDGYNKEITIPENLYIISVSQPGLSSNLPMTAQDYRRLSKGTPFILAPNIKELRVYLQKDKQLETYRDSLKHELYFFAKANEIIENNIGLSATIGQWSGLRELLKEHNFESSQVFIQTHLSKFEQLGKVDKKDFKSIQYAINHNGRVPNSNFIASSYATLVYIGVISELTVGILFAVLSAIGIRIAYLKKKKNLEQIFKQIEVIVKDYMNDTISYPKAYGDLLFIKEKIENLAKSSTLNFAEANYLLISLNKDLQIIDLIHELGEKSEELKLFVKNILSDDQITEEKFETSKLFLNDVKSTIDSRTFCSIEQQLIGLYYKSMAKFGKDV